MRNKYIYVITIFFGLALLSCGGEVSSPKALGVQVFMALQNNDINAYLNLCGGVDEQIYLYNISDMSREDKKDYVKEMLDNRREYEDNLDEDRRDNFQEVQADYNWKEFELDHVELGDMDELHGIKFYSNVYVHFKNDRILEIDIVVKTQHGWKIMDDVALSVTD